MAKFLHGQPELSPEIKLGIRHPRKKKNGSQTAKLKTKLNLEYMYYIISLHVVGRTSN